MTSIVASVRDEVSARQQGTSSQQLWLDKIRAAKAEPTYKKWREDAAQAVAAYEGGEVQGAIITGANLFHSNTETVAPSIYNSTPVPDIRVRFGDPDKITKTAVDMLERVVTYDLDACRFDDLMFDVVRDAYIVGEAMPRIRYEPIEPGESDKVYPEMVPYDRVIKGPSRTWEKTPWLVFEHDMTFDEVASMNKEAAEDISFGGGKTYRERVQAENGQEPEARDTNIFQTAKVFEIWDKKTRTVLWITDKPLEPVITHIDDPLELEGFFPVPYGLRPITKRGKQIPIVQYVTHKALFDEFERVCKRINALIAQLRVRGLYDAKMAPDFKRLKDCADGEYEPAHAAEDFVAGQKRSLADAVMHWPNEQIIQTVRELALHRDAIKALIWEATGVADIMRGNTDPDETLGAQELKTEWGSMRVKKFQAEAARCARDIIRMMVEVRANISPWDWLKTISNMDFAPTEQDIAKAMEKLQAEQPQPMEGQPAPQPPNPQLMQLQAQQAAQEEAKAFEAEVRKLIESPNRKLSIDIEVDSTIKGDVAKDLDQFNQLITVTANFAGAVQGLAPVLPQTVAPLFKVYTAQVRQFRLNKQAEDALDELDEAAKQPPVDPNAPNPEQQAAEQQAMQQQQEADQAKLQAEMQRDERKAQMEERKAETELQLATQKHGMEMELKQLDMQLKQMQIQLDAQKAQMDIEFKTQEQALKREGQQADLQMKMEANSMALQGKQAEIGLKMQAGQNDMAMQHEQFEMDREDRHEEREHNRQVSEMEVESSKHNLAHQQSMAKLKEKNAAKPNGVSR